MPARNLTDPGAVERAIAEADALGPGGFRAKYGFREATEYLLVHRGKLYDSKAIMNVALRFQHGLGMTSVSGGKSRSHAAGRLAELGFKIVERHDERGGVEDNQRHFIYFNKNPLEIIADGIFPRIQDSHACMTEIEPGDIVWVVTENDQNAIVVAARFFVCGANRTQQAKDRLPNLLARQPRSRPEHVVYFELQTQESIADLLVYLGLAKGLATVRNLFDMDESLRLVLGDADMIESRARQLPINDVSTDPAALAEWAAEEATVRSPEADDTPARREYRREMIVRNRGLVIDLKRRYGGACQISGAEPLDGLVGDITEAHHIQWLTRGGPDRHENLVILSPNWHAAVHAAETKFDWANLAFVINGRKFPLRINYHLKPLVA